jgi:hypothetical protein
MNISALFLGSLSLATSVASQMTAEKHIELFHKLWDPVTKGNFAVKNINLDMFADDAILRNPVGGVPDLVGKEAMVELFKERESALISDWWEVRSEFVQQDGILHVFMTIAAVAHNADKSGTCSLFMDALVRQELNEDGNIKLFEIYNDVHGTGFLKCMASTAESQEEQEL